MKFKITVQPFDNMGAPLGSPQSKELDAEDIGAAGSEADTFTSEVCAAHTGVCGVQVTLEPLAEDTSTSPAE